MALTNEEKEGFALDTLEDLLHAFTANNADMVAYGKALSCIRECRFSVPFLTDDAPEQTVGATTTITGKPAFLRHASGQMVLPIFTGDNLAAAIREDLVDSDAVMSLHFSEIFSRAENYDISAIVVNPFTDNFPIPKDMFARVKSVPGFMGLHA